MIAHVVPPAATLAVPTSAPLAYTWTTSPAPSGALMKPETKRPALLSLVVQSLWAVAALLAPLSLVIEPKLTVCVGTTVS